MRVQASSWQNAMSAVGQVGVGASDADKNVGANAGAGAPPLPKVINVLSTGTPPLSSLANAYRGGRKE